MIENKIKSVEEEIKFRQTVDDNTGYTTGVLFALEVHRDDLFIDETLENLCSKIFIRGSVMYDNK